MKKILPQIIKFVGISGIGWLIDFSIFTFLTFVSEINVGVINMISSLIGVSIVFVFSTKNIFSNSKKMDIRIKYLIYIIYQIALILLVSKCIDSIYSLIIRNYHFNNIKYIKMLLKIGITPFTLAINFIVTKKIVEKL